jgi:hypothetical protein
MKINSLLMLKNSIIVALVLFTFQQSVFSQLISEDFEGETVGVITTASGTVYQINNNTGSCDADDVWIITTGNASSSCDCSGSGCAGNRALIDYDSSCDQDATLRIGTFTGQTSVDVSFDWAYDQSGSSTFIATLHNITSGSDIPLISPTTDLNDQTYGPVTHSGLTSSDSYEVRFTYTGSNDWGAQADNILVTSNCSSPTATFTTVDDCLNEEFSIDISVTNFGDATDVNITNDGGVSDVNNAGTGTTQIGPFVYGTDVLVTIDGTTYGGCDLISNTITQDYATSSENVYLTISGGSSLTEKWTNVTTGINGTGTVIWEQGGGSIGTGAGTITDEVISIECGTTYYLNAFDRYDDDWDGTTYTLTDAVGGSIIINNGGASPDDGNDNDATSSWSLAEYNEDLESSEPFNLTCPCNAPSATYTASPDCGNSQFYIDVNVTSFGDGTNVSISNNAGVATSNAVGTGITTIGPFPYNTNVTVTLDARCYGGCETTSSVITEDCSCATPPSATVNTSNIDCNANTFDITVTSINNGDGTSTNIYVDGILDVSGSQLLGKTVGTSYTVTIVANGSGSISCETDYTGITEDCRPDNDICADATSLPCSTINLAGTTINSSNTLDGTGCNLSDYGVWYSFEGDGLANTISAVTSGYNITMAILQGSCGSLTSLSCENSAGNSGTESYTFTSVYGITYFVYIAEETEGGSTTGNFTISRTCVTESLQNCLGGTSVCEDVSFSGNSNGAGTIDDIDGTTGGCLGINENESSWYFFEAASAGTLEFAIKPQNGTDDYDFAVWGPYPSGSTPASICPPSVAPLRCSFAAGAPNPVTGTGLVIGAGDNSENTSGDDIVNEITTSAGDVYIILIDNYSATTSPFDMDMTLTNGLTLNCSPLPITLLNFNGFPEKNYNYIEWNTIEEINNDYFIIESSHDGVLFQPIGNINGAGNSSGSLYYKFIDENPSSGISYYRLKQIDYDGAYTYSNVISIKQSIGAEVSIFPNPTKGNIKLNFVSKYDDQIRICVSNAYNMIYNQELFLPRGNKILEFDFLKDVPSGFYIIKIVDKTDHIIKLEKIIKY